MRDDEIMKQGIPDTDLIREIEREKGEYTDYQENRDEERIRDIEREKRGEGDKKDEREQRAGGEKIIDDFVSQKFGDEWKNTVMQRTRNEDIIEEIEREKGTLA